jgi:hypothetical protein
MILLLLGRYAAWVDSTPTFFGHRLLPSRFAVGSAASLLVAMTFGLAGRAGFLN